MDELIARLEKAAEPDRQLDIALDKVRWPDQHGRINLPYYTHSIDAALTLVPDLIWFEIEAGTQSNGSGRFEWPLVHFGCQRTGNALGTVQVKTLAIALCIAALKARMAVTPRHETEGEK